MSSFLDYDNFHDPPVKSKVPDHSVFGPTGWTSYSLLPLPLVLVLVNIMDVLITLLMEYHVSPFHFHIAPSNGDHHNLYFHLFCCKCHCFTLVYGWIKFYCVCVPPWCTCAIFPLLVHFDGHSDWACILLTEDGALINRDTHVFLGELGW